jgi:2'-5' RNA ligase
MTTTTCYSHKMETKRLFIAIKAPIQSLKGTPELLKKLKTNADKKKMDFKWTQEDNHHITLKFLGATPEEEISQIRHSLKKITQNHDGLTLKIRDMGVFPNEMKGRVLWLGVQNSGELQALQKDVEDEMQVLGFEEDQYEFKPHLTLGRLRNFKSLKDFISPFVRNKFGKLEVTEIILYESKITKHFPVYTPIEVFPLKRD